MNAPWTPGRGSALRQPFAAYVCDEATADVMRPVAAEMGWTADGVNKGGLRNAVQSLSVSASPNILFVDLSESSDPLNDINALAEVCEPGTVVIAAGQVNDVRLYRDLVASGIQDYLLKPLNPDQVRDALSAAQTSLMAPKHAEPGTERPHLATAVIGARGGVGASSVAGSLAWLFGEKNGRSTALLDLDVHFGTGALALDLEPGRGLTDAIDNPSRIDGLFIERAMVRANERLAVLSAEAPISQPLLSEGTAFYQLQEEMKGAFECTVIDLPRQVLVQHPHLLTDLNGVVLVTELTLAAARDCIRILGWLKTNAPGARVLVVANKVAANVVGEIGRKDFEATIERKVDVVVPLDAKLAAQAAKLGKPLAEAGRGAKVSQALLSVANALVDAAETDEPQGKTPGKPRKAGVPAAGASLMEKFGGLKSMLPAVRRKP